LSSCQTYCVLYSACHDSMLQRPWTWLHHVIKNEERSSFRSCGLNCNESQSDPSKQQIYSPTQHATYKKHAHKHSLVSVTDRQWRHWHTSQFLTINQLLDLHRSSVSTHAVHLHTNTITTSLQSSYHDGIFWFKNLDQLASFLLENISKTVLTFLLIFWTAPKKITQMWVTKYSGLPFSVPPCVCKTPCKNFNKTLV